MAISFKDFAPSPLNTIELAFAWILTLVALSLSFFAPVFYAIEFFASSGHNGAIRFTLWSIPLLFLFSVFLGLFLTRIRSPVSLRPWLPQPSMRTDLRATIYAMVALFMATPIIMLSAFFAGSFVGFVLGSLVSLLHLASWLTVPSVETALGWLTASLSLRLVWQVCLTVYGFYTPSPEPAAAPTSGKPAAYDYHIL